MNYSIDFIKGEYAGLSSLQCWENEELIPQPMEALLETGTPPFLSKTYDFVDDPSTNEIVSWSRGDNSFIVWDTQTLATNLLPKYFKHSNFSSFVRQLNKYGFRKVDPDKWEFANEGFLRGRRDLLKNIIKRKTKYWSSQKSDQSTGSCVDVGNLGVDEEIDRLSCDKRGLAMELAKLRRQQQTTLSCLKTMEQRLEGAEMKQRQTTSFLAKTLRNPTFLQQISRLEDQKKEIEEEMSNQKRRRILDNVAKNVGLEELVFQENNSSIIGNSALPRVGQVSMENAYKNDAGIGQFGDGDFYVKLESQEHGDIPRFGDLELEKLALSMQKPQVIMEGKTFGARGL